MISERTEAIDQTLGSVNLDATVSNRNDGRGQAEEEVQHKVQFRVIYMTKWKSKPSQVAQ